MDRKLVNVKDSVIQQVNVVGRDQINNYNASPLNPRTLGDWLSSLNFNMTQANVWEQRTDGTGTWFLESREFKAWLTSAAQETLWCIGIPGSGKTVLSSIAIKYLQEAFRGKDVATTFIYCNHKEQAKHTVRELIASMLKQLVQDHPVISESAGSLYDKHHSKATYPSLEELTEAIRMEVGRYSRVFVIVDALDELDELHRVRLIEAIQTLSNAVNLMVTSRPPPPIEAISGAAKSMEISASAHDVRVYIQHRIQKEPRLKLLAGERGDLQQSIVDKISGTVQGMFLLAKLHMDTLATKNNPRAVRDALDVLPTEVEATYGEAMRRITAQSKDDEDLAKRILFWVIFARRPLSLRELQHAIATLPRMTDIDPESLVPEILLISVCAGLVVIDGYESIVSLVHYTAQEYFEKNGPTLFPHAAGSITQTCLTYLSFDALTQGGDAWSTLHKYPFALYAAVHWGYHARRDEETTLDMVLEFLSRKPNVAYATTILLAESPDGLWDYGLDQTDFGEMHLLSLFGLGRTMSQLLQINHSADLKDSTGQTPLSHAATQGHSEVVQLLLTRDDIDVNSEDEYGNSPLFYAANSGHLEVTKLLLARDDIDVNSKDEEGNSLLFIVAAKKHLEVMKLLLARDDIEVNSKDEYGCSSLWYAAEKGDLEATKLLLAQDDIEVNSKDDEHSRSPLSCAAKNGHLEVTKLLLARDDIEVNSKDKYNHCPLSYATKKEHLRVRRRITLRDDIEANSIHMDKDGNMPLLYPAGNRHLEVMKLLLARDDIEVNSKDECSRSPLGYAAEKGDLEAMKLLLARDDIEVNSKDECSRSPLSGAAKNGHLEVMKLLLARDDIEVNLKDKYSRSPLSYAAKNGHLEVVKLLLARDDIEVNLKGKHGGSPLSYAARNGHSEVTKLLLAQDDIEVNSKDKYGRSPLSFAAENGHLEVTKLLLAQDGIDVNSKDNRSQSPLAYARGYPEIVQLFMVRTTAGLSSPNDIMGSPATVSSSYPQSDIGTKQHPFHNILENSTTGKRKQRSDEIFVDTEKRSKSRHQQ